MREGEGGENEWLETETSWCQVECSQIEYTTNKVKRDQIAGARLEDS